MHQYLLPHSKSSRTNKHFAAFLSSCELVVRSTEAGNRFADICKALKNLLFVGNLILRGGRWLVGM